jgi:hypothetical protein
LSLSVKGEQVREGRGCAAHDLPHLGARLELQKSFEIEFHALLTDGTQEVHFERAAVS